MKKKKLLYHSNHCKAFTGFGKNAKNILKYLYKTGKYEIVEASNGIVAGDKSLDKMPWKTLGMIPNDPIIQQEWGKDPGKARTMAYGGALIDEVIKKEKPDIYLGVEDIWAFTNFWEKTWWNKVNCMVWTTLDSLPILPDAVKAAPQIKNYYVWATFAEKALKKLGHDHVKTLRGSLDTDMFHRFSDEIRKQSRSEQDLSPGDFIIGFVFRNQLRKSVPNILDGFKLFLEAEPKSGAKLLLHTHWGEGWDIPRLLNEKDIDPANVLTTYFCKKCQAYEIKPFSGQAQDCRFCGGKQTQNTTTVGSGVSDKQLNEIYNLMDVYCHPFTSGGQEIPVQEAKLTELVTLVTNYSCGEDSCSPSSAGLPLDWAEYREPGTQFIKASTSARSILKQLTKVYRMKPSKKRALEKKARQWVIDNFSISVIGKQLESILDSMSTTDWDFDFSEPPRDPDYKVPTIENDADWLKDIYKNILKMNVDENDEGYKHWMKQMSEGRERQVILDFFRQTATKENQNINKDDHLQSLAEITDDEKDKRLVIVVPGTIGDIYMSTALLPSLAKTYPDYAIYFSTKPEYFDILNGNPYVYKVIPYDEKFNDLLYLEGRAEHPGFFDIAFLPTLGTQKMFNYQHNAQDIIDFDLCTS